MTAAAQETGYSLALSQIPDSFFSLSCSILIMLCIIFLVLMDGVRLYSGWPTRGLFLMALFGVDATLINLLDVRVTSLFAGIGVGTGETISQLLLIFMPFLLMLYYVRVVSTKYRPRMLRLLVFDAGLAVFLIVIFLVFPRERIVTEVYSLFALMLSVLGVIITLLQWHGGQKGYRRVYWEIGALIFLAISSGFRFSGDGLFMITGSGMASVRQGGFAIFMLIMTGMQFYAILMEYRTMMENTARQLEVKNAELIEARKSSAAVAPSRAADTAGNEPRSIGMSTDSPVSGSASQITAEPAESDVQASASYTPAVSPGPSAEQMPVELPVVEGLDWGYARLHLPDEEMLAESIGDFYELIGLQAEKLEGYAVKLDEAISSGDEEARTAALDAYRIQVHGMKSSAATVGIIYLAGMAGILEAAARDGDAAGVAGSHATFIRAWLSYKDRLRGVFGVGEDETEGSGEQADPAAVGAMLTVLKSAMDEMDVDSADQVMKELKQFSYSAEVSEKLGRLQAAVTDLDSDMAGELADEITEMLGA